MEDEKIITHISMVLYWKSTELAFRKLKSLVLFVSIIQSSGAHFGMYESITLGPWVSVCVTFVFYHRTPLLSSFLKGPKSGS